MATAFPAILRMFPDGRLFRRMADIFWGKAAACGRGEDSSGQGACFFFLLPGNSAVFSYPAVPSAWDCSSCTGIQEAAEKTFFHLVNKMPGMECDSLRLTVSLQPCTAGAEFRRSMDRAHPAIFFLMIFLKGGLLKLP